MGNALEMFISGVPALRELVRHGHQDVIPVEGALLPVCPHAAPVSCIPDGGSSPGWGGDSCPPGGGQLQRPHIGAAPNWVLTCALGRGW